MTVLLQRVPVSARLNGAADRCGLLCLIARSNSRLMDMFKLSRVTLRVGFVLLLAIGLLARPAVSRRTLQKT